MIIYEVTTEFDSVVTQFYKKSNHPTPEYLNMSLEEFAENYPAINAQKKEAYKDRKPQVYSWVHSWYVDELQERIVKLTAEGKLEEIKIYY